MDLLEDVERQSARSGPEAIQQAADVPQETRRFTGGVLDDGSTRRIRRVARDAGRAQGNAVQHERVRAIDRHWMIGCGRVQFLARGESMLAEPRRIHPWGPNPGVTGSASGLAADPCLQGTDRWQAPERLHSLRGRDIERMHMRVDETWHDGASTAVDHARVAADKPPRVFVRTDRDEAPVTDGQRSSLAETIVDGQ